MPSFIVRSTDIAVTLQRIEEVVTRSGGSVVLYKRDSVRLLQREDYKRIQYFYYCDDANGITVRVYDPQFANSPDVRPKDPQIIFRAEKIGKPGETVKSELLQIWEQHSAPPQGVNTNSTGAADVFFMTLNGGSMQAEAASIGNSAEVKISSIPRYESLWETTCIDSDFFIQFENALISFKQVILEGPPGSGKTWVAREFAKWWTSREADAGNGSDWRIVQLHESYGYEDFFQGIRPVLLDAQGAEIPSGNTTSPVDKLVYRHTDGVFRKLCKMAESNRDARFVLIIDEINRGKTSRVFGELLYLLEYRDESMTLASGEEFSVPPNIFLIGTMNTADRSIALVDYALRRRFRFVALRSYVDGTAPVLSTWLERREVTNGQDIVRLYCALNAKISHEIDEHQIVGHSYFMLKSLESPGSKEFEKGALEQVWKQSLLPLIAEYRPGVRAAEIEAEYGLFVIEAESEQPRK